MLVGLLGALLIAACSDGLVPPGNGNVIVRGLDVVSGSEQFGRPGEMLPEPLVVKVTDASGQAVNGQVVNFRVVSGGGSVFAGSGLSGQDGIVKERWTLGMDTSITQRVEARAVDPATGAPLVFATFTARFGTPPAVLDTIILTPVSASIQAGQTQQFTAVARDASGNVMQGVALTWSSTSGSIASVSTSGLVTGIVQGTTTIRVSSGSEATTAAVTVTAPPPPPPAPSTGSVADPTLLPSANRQLPNFETYIGRNLRAGQSYSDPVTSVRVVKVTDNTTPVANAGTHHDYASGSVQISREWGTGSHTLHVWAGDDYLVDYTRGAGLSNWRRASFIGPDLSFTFSLKPSTPRIAYYLVGNVLHRYNTETMMQENTGNFPKNFTGAAAGTLLWLHQDKNDRWFVMMQNDAALVIAWNSETNQTRTLSATRLGRAIDEPHFEKDGRYVMIAHTSQSYSIWDLETDQVTGPTNLARVHAGGARSNFVGSNPDLGTAPLWRLNPASGFRTDIFTGSAVGTGDQHRADQWVQTGATIDANLTLQWMLHGISEDGEVAAGTWTVHSGQIHVTTPNFAPAYQKPSIGVRSVRQFVTGDVTRVSRQLTQVSSLGALVEGSFFYDATATRLYVWAAGGGSPAGRVALRAPARSHDALAFVRLDGSDMRLLVHHYSEGTNDYWEIPRATISADGKLVMFDSNMNDTDGRVDVFVAEVPIR